MVAEIIAEPSPPRRAHRHDGISGIFTRHCSIHYDIYIIMSYTARDTLPIYILILLYHINSRTSEICVRGAMRRPKYFARAFIGPTAVYQTEPRVLAVRVNIVYPTFVESREPVFATLAIYILYYNVIYVYRYVVYYIIIT